MTRYIALREIIDEMSLEIIYESQDLDQIEIYSSEISRSGLQITGYYEKFVPERIQIIGSAEWHYLSELEAEERYKSIEKFFSYPISALIISRDLDCFPEMLELAKKYDRTILRTDKRTTRLTNDMVSLIDMHLAAETRVHGVFVEVFGVGVLIGGKSGVGKSETALDLVMRGHRLISDDVVIIKKLDDHLFGRSPDITRHFMEIRGLGIIDIERLYGVGAVKYEETIEMMIELELWDQKKEYDRTGLDENLTDILGLQIPIITIPVRPGRNIAMIIEVATRNFRQKRLGYNAAEELNRRISQANKKRKDLARNKKTKE